MNKSNIQGLLILLYPLDLRKEYGIKILEPEERVIADPLIWEGTISN